MWKIKSWPVKCNMEGNQRGLCAEQAVPICGTAPPPAPLVTAASPVATEAP